MKNENGFEFMDLAAVDKSESVSDTATVLIEEDGVIKRVPKSEVGVSSWNRLKDKPFYEEEELVTVIPETKFYSDDNDWYSNFDNIDYYRTGIGEYPQLEYGVTYVVNFDGVDYICESIKNDITGEGDNYFFIGNHKIYNEQFEGNNEPFHIKQSEFIGHNTNITILAPSGEHTISISKRETITHKIDKKYIPSSIGGVNVEVLVLREREHDTFDSISQEDFDRIFNAILNGIPVAIWLLEPYDYIINNPSYEYHGKRSVGSYQYFIYEVDACVFYNDDGTEAGKYGIYLETYDDDYFIDPDGTVENY